MFLGVRKDDDDNPTIFLENNSEAIAFSLGIGNPVNYFLINIVNNAVTLKPITIKGGPRAAGKVMEIVDIQAGNDIVGSAEVPKL